MTCIVGIAQDKKVYMGGDSAGVDEAWNLTIRADKKVFTLGIEDEFVVGFTTSYRMGQLLKHQLLLPDYTHLNDLDEEIEHYMVSQFIEAIRFCFRNYGYLKKENEQESGGQFLVGFRGRLFQIDSDFQVGRPLNGYAAVGVGAKVALGALYASRRREPLTRINLALEAAAHFTIGIQQPFYIIEPNQSNPNATTAPLTRSTQTPSAETR